MIRLDYQTNNPRWGWSGMEFMDWNGYSLTLGFLSNIDHYKTSYSSGKWGGSISVHVEGNNQQGAWEKEGRIHYYKDIIDLEKALPDLYNHSSKGNTGITRRINSNEYILSLVREYHFLLKTYIGYTTADIFPPHNAFVSVKGQLQLYLSQCSLTIEQVDSCLNAFDYGWGM